MTPRLSIVVPTMNRRESVLRLLRALRAQTLPPSDFEVVVVVNASTDGTAEALDGLQTPYTLRHLELAQPGLAGARNAGARAAVAPVVQFLDDDMEPAPGMAAAHLERHARGDTTGVVGPVPIVVPPDAAPVVRYRAKGFARKLERLAGRRDDLAFNDVYGGNTSFLRDALLAAGGYDERFTAYGHEDYELSLRLSRAGHRFAYAPDAVAQQHYDKTVRELADDVESEGRTAVAFARTHPDVLPSLPLGGFGRRAIGVRFRLALLLLLDRRTGDVPARLLRAAERGGRAQSRIDDVAMFARYDRLFDALFWIGAERTLRERGVPSWRIAVADVARWIGAP